MDHAASVISEENTELACAFIQKTAVEKALPEMDKRLTSVSNKLTNKRLTSVSNKLTNKRLTSVSNKLTNKRLTSVRSSRGRLSHSLVFGYIRGRD